MHTFLRAPTSLIIIRVYVGTYTHPYVHTLVSVDLKIAMVLRLNVVGLFVYYVVAVVVVIIIVGATAYRFVCM